MMTPDAKLDLVLERTTDLAPEQVWKAWTTPSLMTQWFTPAPWQTVDAELDLRPGGIFRTVMCSPEGEEFPGEGCILEVVENRRLMWTDALKSGYRPVAPGDSAAAQAPFHFTAIIELEPHGSGTRYVATAMHGDEAGRAKHEAMGFREGWGAAFDQLVALMKATP